MGASTTSLAAAVLLLLLLMSLAAAADMSIISYGDGERSEEETRRMYAEWMETHGRRSYNASEEEQRRYQVFKDTLHYIDEHNAATDAGVRSFRLGLIPPTAVTTGIAAAACRWCCC